MESSSSEALKPKYQLLFDTLFEDIRSGRFRSGEKLPSEAALVKQFSTSRITVGRALRELKQLGLVDRVAGSGTFVRENGPPLARSLLFGLLIPDLGETEIFEPICNGIAHAGAASDHALLWGHSTADRADKEQQARELTRQYIARDVSGVFFAPLEFEREADKANRAVLGALDSAGIPTVLLDRRPASGSERRRHDLVGLNNRHAGYVATSHLVGLGAKRIGFLGYHGAPSTVAARRAGYEAALLEQGLPLIENPAQDLETDSNHWEKRDMEGWICVNDRVAGQLMHSLLAAGMRIPEDVRIVGIDDSSYASLLPVPLTTVRQPCREIGEAALTTMLERVRNPASSSRDLLLDGELVVRRSCGARTEAKAR